MKIILNGKPTDSLQALTLQQLVEQYAKDPAHIVAELDGAVIARSAWGATPLSAGSAVELLTFVGGG